MGIIISLLCNRTCHTHCQPSVGFRTNKTGNEMTRSSTGKAEPNVEVMGSFFLRCLTCLHWLEESGD